ncbi:hypothetical protein SKAU_G00251760 [Synaphobranchus kaupii]|uniref:Uncharacterized protein n=1 Tax=Synaphobranchus kaupii TaxID=118154 RepID=A0A9Q1IR10_SYNKA|nr:hypothetical protein SKAU_G00251760 [Synaphobranchus kaupii]
MSGHLIVPLRAPGIPGMLGGSFRVLAATRRWRFEQRELGEEEDPWQSGGGRFGSLCDAEDSVRPFVGPSFRRTATGLTR